MRRYPSGPSPIPACTVMRWSGEAEPVALTPPLHWRSLPFLLEATLLEHRLTLLLGGLGGTHFPTPPELATPFRCAGKRTSAFAGSAAAGRGHRFEPGERDLRSTGEAHAVDAHVHIGEGPGDAAQTHGWFGARALRAAELLPMGAVLFQERVAEGMPRCRCQPGGQHGNSFDLGRATSGAETRGRPPVVGPDLTGRLRSRLIEHLRDRPDGVGTSHFPRAADVPLLHPLRAPASGERWNRQDVPSCTPRR